MSLKQPAIMLAAVALSAAAGSAPVLAQSESCLDQYNRVTALYQTAPLSPEYSQMAAAYSARCLAGTSAVAPPAYYGSTTGYGYNGPAYSGYGYSGPAYAGYGYNGPPYYGYGSNAPVYYGPGYPPHITQHGTVQ